MIIPGSRVKTSGETEIEVPIDVVKVRDKLSSVYGSFDPQQESILTNEDTKRRHYRLPNGARVHVQRLDQTRTN